MSQDRELDIRASADAVVALFEQDRARDAIELLERMRQDQPQAVQEALDRYVAADCGRYLDAFAASFTDDADQALRQGLQRLDAARHEPRFPADVEMDRLASDAQRYDVYASIVVTRGSQAAQDALARNERVILGLRQENSTLATTTRANPDEPRSDDPRTANIDESRLGTGVYDDRLVVLWKDAQGVRHLHPVERANTEPTAQYDAHARPGRHQAGTPFGSVNWRRAEGEDVNADRVADLGRLADGTFEMRRTTHPNPLTGRPEFSLRPTADEVSPARREGRVERDTNADGWFTEADVNGAQALNDTFKIHRGSRANTDSAGCQTIHADDYSDFIDAATGNPNQTRWQYVLTSTTPGMWRNVEARVNGMPEAEAPAQPPPRDVPPAHNRPEPMAPGRDEGARLRPRGPADRDHPDHALLLNIREHVHRLAGLDCGDDERTENLCRALLPVAKENGLRRVDHVVLSVDNGRVKAGENVFLVEGALDDPAHLRTFAKTEAAMTTPIPASDQRLEDVNRQLADAAVQAHAAVAQQASHGPSPMRV